MNIVEAILSRPEIKSLPPVLVDIGASGGIHPKWKRIARHCVCIAFDADNREMAFAEKETETYKRLIVFGRAVTDRADTEVEFFLTKSPYCSSALEPDTEKLKNWSFRDLFTVEKRSRLKAIRLVDALKEAKVEGVDWLKIDTQGTDLRLFKSLPESIHKRVIVAEFEPGILDAYKGEEKLYEVIQYMESSGYFLSSMEVKGTQRIDPDELNSFSNLEQQAFHHCHVKSPGWAELTYIKHLRDDGDKRTFLLAVLFSTLLEQHGFACELAKAGQMKTGDSFFSELHRASIRLIRRKTMRLPAMFLKKAGQKVLSYF